MLGRSLSRIWPAINPAIPMVASNLIGEAKRLLTGNQFAADEDKAKILSGYLRRADSLLLRRDIQRLEK